ncbi:MAG: 16S rRNA (adenine1518-N6/adenine1519-N6)-dimethyltransferase [Parcubacteria group bacterium Licking1014_17]|nr:MAG: 16S rRNA (adenine1518-N6/adenine1519-N6)-dimethyltransferase [Parcubacteria group bacterium Licking1014_17]
MTAGEKIKKRMEEWGIVPKKTMGQNFLADDGVYGKIAGSLGGGGTVVEIGAGLGTLTDCLAEKYKEVIAIEKDDLLAFKLKEFYKDKKNIVIEENDVLRFNPKKFGLDLKPYDVAGNIPYYLTARLLRTIFTTWHLPKRMVLTTQNEVARRITASPPDMSMLAVLAQYFSTPSIIMAIPAEAFIPPPEINSAVVLFEFNKKIQPPDFSKKMFSVAKTGFSRKRGQLINTLSAGLQMPKEKISDVLAKNSIDPKQRAETLTVEQWQNITVSLFPR